MNEYKIKAYWVCEFWTSAQEEKKNKGREIDN